ASSACAGSQDWSGPVRGPRLRQKRKSGPPMPGYGSSTRRQANVANAVKPFINQPMKTVMVAAIGCLFALSATLAKPSHCTFRVHTEANANDGSVFATPFHSPFSNRDVFIQKTAWISERDVAGFYPY